MSGRFLLRAVGKQSNRERYLRLHPAMSRSDIDDIFHVFQVWQSHFGDSVTAVMMVASARRRGGGPGRWPTGVKMVGKAALGVLALLGNIHSAKGA